VEEVDLHHQEAEVTHLAAGAIHQEEVPQDPPEGGAAVPLVDEAVKAAEVRIE
jgi:hypothetical protein